MLFNSFNFLFYLPIVFVLYWHVFQRNLRWQNLFVVVASYVFYGWWDWRFLLLIVFTSLCSYGSGLLIDHCFQRDEQITAKWWAGLNIVVNLLVLGIFKYFNFFADSFQTVMAGIGMTIDAPTLHVILPVGISFYTFQALSYTIDVYRRQLPATRDVVAFFAFISFFPQLVAGPIERATNLLPQFQNCRSFDYAKAVDGLRQMLWGFFKKLVVADNCAFAVDSIWESYTDQTGFMLFLGGTMFAFQIYCDFSGYSDIAIGCARLFGISLSRNFNYPYFSRSIPEFWRRWHISLMTWLRDYIYFLMGGSRCYRWKVVRNILVVFFISGLWHGANWTFICWGLYHACLVSVYFILNINTKLTPNRGRYGLLYYAIDLGKMVMTFVLVVVGWIIFRSASIHEAYHYLSAMFNISIFDVTESIILMEGMYLPVSIPMILIMLCAEWIQRNSNHALEFHNVKLLRSPSLRWSVYYLLIICILQFGGSEQSFIYFQF